MTTKNQGFWDFLSAIVFFFVVLFAVIALTFGLGGCTGAGTDSGNCSMTGKCPTDAGQMTTDAGQTTNDTTPDANTVPDANVDACAAYAGQTLDGWQCTTGSAPWDCNFTLFSQNGQCYLSCNFACPVPSTTDMSAGNFTCTPTTGTGTISCWHNNL